MKYLTVLICILIFKGYLPISPYNAQLHFVDFKFKSLFKNFLCTFYKLSVLVNDQAWFKVDETKPSNRSSLILTGLSY